MKILFVATVDIHIINHHLRIIHKLHEMGHQVDVAAKGDFKNEDITVKYNLPFSKKPYSLDNLKAQKQIRAIMVKENYDIISCHTPLSSFYTRLATKGLKSKVIYTTHGFHFFKGAPLINQTIYKTMEKIAAKYTDVLVTINQEDYENAKQFRLKQGGKVVFIPGVGIEEDDVLQYRTNKEIIKQELGLNAEDKMFLSVGELNKNKNHIFVMEALKEWFHKNQNNHFVVCGEGPDHEKLSEWIQKENLTKQIHLLGYRKDLRRILFGADVFISPSYRVGLPVSVLEAMVAGIPVIASNVRGNHDLIKDGVNGFLYPVDNQEVFRTKMRQLMEDKTCANRFVKKAQEDAHGYASEVVDPQILALYASK